MKISYVTDFDPSQAATRLRMLIPGGYAERNGHEVYVGDEPVGDIAVFSKHFRPENILQARDFGGISVYDISDYHRETKFRPFYEAMIRVSNYLTCSSDRLSDEIANWTDIRPTVIKEPYDFMIKQPAFDPSCKQVIWYGHMTNIQHLLALRLEERLVIVTNMPEKEYANSYVLPYNKVNIESAMTLPALVVLPSDPSDIKCTCKSPNRMVTALNLGRFAIASPIDSYKEFKDFCWLGDIEEGIAWARENPKEVIQRIRAGQAYIGERYHEDTIGQQWLDFFTSAVIHGTAGLRYEA